MYRLFTKKPKVRKRALVLSDALYCPPGFESKILEGKVHGLLLEGHVSNLANITKTVLVNPATGFVVEAAIRTVIQARISELTDTDLVDLGFPSRAIARESLNGITGLSKKSHITAVIWDPNSLSGVLAGSPVSTKQAASAFYVSQKLQENLQENLEVVLQEELVESPELTSSSDLTEVEPPGTEEFLGFERVHVDYLKTL